MYYIFYIEEWIGKQLYTTKISLPNNKTFNAINSDIQLGHSAYLYTMFMKNKMKLNLWEENKGVSSTEWTECVSKSNAVQTILQWDLSQCLIFMNVLQYIRICICMRRNRGPNN